MTKVKAQISNECQMTNAKKYVTTLVQSSMVHACPPRPETGTGSGGAT